MLAQICFDYWFRSPDGIAELEKLQVNTTNVCAIYQESSPVFGAHPTRRRANRIVAKVDELMSLCDAAGSEPRRRQ